MNVAATAAEKSMSKAMIIGGGTISNTNYKIGRKMKRQDEIVYGRLHMGLSRRATNGG